MEQPDTKSAMRLVIAQVENYDYSPDVIIMNLLDWFSAKLYGKRLPRKLKKYYTKLLKTHGS